jgi:hypothetical protein
MANTKITSRVIADNSVGIDALNVTDGTNGQYLQTDGAGTLSFSTVSGYTDSDVETYLDGGTSTPILASFTVGSSYPLTSYDDASQNLGITLDTPFNSINNGGYNTSLFAPLANLTDGYSNAAFGLSVLTALTSGSNNTFFGNFSAQNITTASNNTGIGTYTLVANTASDNTAVGYYALYANTTGIDNVAMGVYALQANTTASNNTALGTVALYTNTTGASNTAVGKAALYENTTGYDNVAIGHNALNANTTGVANTALGTSALLVNTTASNNTAVGKEALKANTTGINNVAVGNYAGLAQTTANANAIFGYNTGRAVTTGTSNTLLGKDAGEAITTGSYNTVVGRDVGANLTTGSFNTYVGYLAGTNNSAATGEIVIGAGNNFFVGKGNSTGFISPSGGGVYQGNNSSTWSTTSDRRIKKNIEDNNVGLDAIKQIQVRNFEYRTEDEIVDFEHPSSAVVKKEGIQLGVIAQEIEEILPDLVKTESTGVKSVNPDNLTWYLVNAVKELSAEVEELKSRLGD